MQSLCDYEVTDIAFQQNDPSLEPGWTKPNRPLVFSSTAKWTFLFLHFSESRHFNRENCSTKKKKKNKNKHRES